MKSSIATTASAPHMNRKRQRASSSSLSWRSLIVGFIGGVMVCSIGSLIHYTDEQFQATIHNQERDNWKDCRYGLAPPPRIGANRQKCNCSESTSFIQKSNQQQPIDDLPLLENGIYDNNKTYTNSNPMPMKRKTPNTVSQTIQDWDPSASAVIVTKIQGDRTFGSLNQMLCLLKYAYNVRVNYDIVVFTADPISEENLQELQETVAPAKLNVVVDNPGLQTMVDALSVSQRNHLLKRCNNTINSSALTWQTKCNETTSAGTSTMNIGYNWQAEFRSLHIWEHPALSPYEYMLWMDTDAFCTKQWKQDPIAVARRNNLVLLFDAFPAGRAKGIEWMNKTKEAFGKPICEISMERSTGTLHARLGGCTRPKALRQVYGFFHVTNLNFYRSDRVMRWQRIMIDDAKFSRYLDDQTAVTIPAAVYAGSRAWSMRHHGLNMSVMHNFVYDGQKSERAGAYFRFWNWDAKTVFPEAYNSGQCKIVSRG